MSFKKIFLLKVFLIFSFYSFNLDALKLTRAIVSWDNNHTFDFFWPIVSKAWSKLIGIRPTLIFLGPKSAKLDETYGDIVYISPIFNIPTPFQAMAIRQLAASLFPDDVCIISDLDMIPVDKKYFDDAIKDVPENNFAVFYPNFHGINFPQYMMCYTAAKGSTYAEVFKIKNISEIRSTIAFWYSKFYKKYKNSTDERMLYKYIHRWKYKGSRLSLLKIPLKRLDRPAWHLDKNKIMNKEYADLHLPRPYILNKNDIDSIVKLLDL